MTLKITLVLVYSLKMHPEKPLNCPYVPKITLDSHKLAKNTLNFGLHPKNLPSCCLHPKYSPCSKNHPNWPKIPKFWTSP